MSIFVERQPGLVMFDLDGTLIDSAQDLLGSANVMLQKLGRDRVTDAQVRDWVGNGAAVLVRRALAGCFGGPGYDAVPEVQCREGLSLFREDYRLRCTQATGLYPGVENGLAMLHEAGLTLAVITNKPYEFTVPILESSGIAPLFSSVIGGDSLPRKKPDPDQLLHCLRELRVADDMALMVGDSNNDIQAAKAANVAIAAVTYGYNHGFDLHSAGVDWVGDSIEDLARDILK